MSLVKWFRKNNKKLMAIVVVILMFGFIGGEFIRQLGRRGRAGLHTPVAYFADDRKITNNDLALARRELEILKMLRANVMLTSQDLQMILLGELLFSERGTSAALINHIKQVIRANRYRISDKQINDIYRRSMPNHTYWLLLKSEAQFAGTKVSNKNSGTLLASIIPQLFNGATYSQLIGSLINQRGIPEEETLTTFSKLLATLEYAMIICSNENATIRQIMHNTSLESETIDVEFVRFDSALFAEIQDGPAPQKMAEHFDKYKKFSAGTVSKENPYGFGYKLADRVKFEYLAVKLDDISTIVTPPTHQEAEEYYEKHREQYTEQVSSDPNDPDSPPIERTKSYAEAANDILKSLLQNKINSKAESILQDAKTLTEAGLQDIDTEPASLSAEQFTQIAGDYEAAAEQLTKKHKIKVYTGQTGMLSADDIRMDKHLGMLYLQGHGYNTVSLPQVVFAIDELKVSELGPFDAPRPRLYENIGPVTDILGRITAVMRVIEAEKASEPESINQTYSTKTLTLERATEQASEDVYSVKEKVVEDLKKLAAMDTAKSKTQEFIALAAKDGWENAIDKFNELYGKQAGQGEAATDAFKLQNLTNLKRMSRERIGTLTVQNAGDPTAQFLVDASKKEALFTAQLYSLVPQDRDTVEALPLIVEFKPDMNYYVIKNISVKRLDQQQYENIKTLQVYKEGVAQSQSLAAVHFRPENILKRMNFRWVRKEEETDVNAPAVPKGAS